MLTTMLIKHRLKFNSIAPTSQPLLMPNLLIQIISSFIFLSILLSAQNCDAQYITHINSRGLKGNLTFNVVKDESGDETLVIESIIETDQLKRIRKLEDEAKFDSSVQVLFDWSIHSKTLESNALISCSDDDLGSINEKVRNLITSGRRIVADKVNRWTLPMKDIVDAYPDARNGLGTFIWGKNVRLKLAPIYGSTQTVSSTPRPSQVGSSPSSSTQPKPSPSTGLSRPKVSLAAVSSTTPPPKPTFAPRPKPNISGKFKTSSSTKAPSLPKPQALVFAEDSSDLTNSGTLVALNSNSSTSTTTTTSTSTTTTTTTTTPAPPKKLEDDLAARTNKEILRLYGGVVVCGNIVDLRNVKTAEAVFESQVAGRITIRGNEDDTTLLLVNLYHVRSKVTTKHDWKIMASDILDNRRDDEKCKYLQVIFDPNNTEDSECGIDQTSKCRMGDLTRKHGQVQVAGQGRNTRSTLVDLNLPLSALEGSRSLFLVIYEVATKSSSNGLPVKPSILSCAQITSVSSRKLEATFNMDGVRGSISISQRHISEPTSVNYDLFGLEGNIKHLSIRELPLAQRNTPDNVKLCSNLGEVFNPTKVNDPVQHQEKSTLDAFKVGNLTAKHGNLMVIDSEYEDRYMGDFTDLTITLFGLNTVAGRSILIQKNNGDPWVCATLELVDSPINLAAATFYYPVVGQILFQQLSNNPHSETGVQVEVYHPNGEKSSDGHNWLVHLKPAMADFYNWSQRCQSVGDIFDPILASVGLNNEAYARQCQTSLSSEPMRCRSGDTSLKSGFKLSLPVSYKQRERYYYTDLFLPLSGPNSIIGRSVVIYDEQSPTQRGNRLACSTIKMKHSLKASVKTWNSGPSIPSNVRGLISFEQESPVKMTRVKIDLNGFGGNVENYAIHEVWTMEDREFPCSNDSLFGIYDPFDIENSLRLPPSAHYGSLATGDRVKVGDLSRKHGTLEGLQSVQRVHIDANAPLFAPHSLVGRSIVLRAAFNDFRWVCGNIDLDFDKSQTREIIGIASFDEPRSKVSGYVRFFQLEHKDGSLSDTYVQVDLKLQSDGIHELETSKGHNWAVFVNQVGEDAFIVADDVRCIAAGFKWNPYLARDTHDSYPDYCNPNEQLGCAMGDLGMRHGSLTLGPSNRIVIADSNLPLAGNYSIMGRSLIIFDSKRPSVKLACANIFPDIHLKSNVVIKRTPTFTVAKFIEQMRSLLGATDWLMVPELRSTKSVANGECVQMTIHFYGQKAHQMQVELNNLISMGTVRKSTRAGTVDKISTHYKLCRTGEMQLVSSVQSILIVSYNLFLLLALVCIATTTTVTISLMDVSSNPVRSLPRSSSDR